MDQITTVQFKDDMEEIARICQVENDGCQTLKSIHLLVSKKSDWDIYLPKLIFQRALVQHFDKGSGEELIRLDTDGAPKSGSPHIYAEKVNK